MGDARVDAAVLAAVVIDGVPFGVPQIGLGAALMGVVLMVLTGRLVPRRYLDDSIRREEAQAEINRANAATLIEMGSAVRDIVQLGRTTNYMLQAIQGHAGEHPQQREATP